MHLFPLVMASLALGLSAWSRAVEDAAPPPAVVEWIAASKAKAPKVEDLFVARAASKSPRVAILGRAFEGTRELATFERAAVLAATDRDVIAIDAGFLEVEAADRWIRTGEGDLAQIVASCSAFGWSAAEVEGLLRSLRERETKPVLAGIGVGAPKPACEEFLAYLKKAYAEGAPRAERTLASLRGAERDGVPRYYLLDENERAILRYGIEELASLVPEREADMVAKSSRSEFAHGVRLLASLQQYESTMRFERDGGDSDPRGRILCENAVAALAAKGEKSRLLALVNVRDVARASDPDSFAARIAASLQERPLCIATAAGEASFRALDPNAHDKGVRAPRELAVGNATLTPLESALSLAGGEVLLDLRAAPRPEEVGEWLKASHTLRSARASCGGAGETPWDYSVAEDFDVIAWFPRLSASKP